MLKFSYLKSINSDYIDELFQRYLADPNSIDDSWRYFFDGLELGTVSSPSENGHSNGRGTQSAPQTAQASPVISLASSNASVDLSSEAKVAEMIHTYRDRGRLLANINPLEPSPSTHPDLELGNFQLRSEDLPRNFTAGKLIGLGPATLRDILTRLRDTYCASIGIEFTHMQDRESRLWLQERMEKNRNREELSPDTRRHILKRLSQSESFERFLHTRYVAQKRFSVEGGEALIPGLDRIIHSGADLGVEQIVLGMAHRGRLNVLVNVYGKKPEHVFTEFEDNYSTDVSMGEGDVKYHMGYSADITTPSGKKVHLSLASNPSHLEVVNPVVEGICQAKQHQLKDTERTKVVPVLIHGDAAFSGQGVVYETLNLAHLDGYSTGGTIHIVINNQVGFTTDPFQSRSTIYCTDLAKMLQVPILHVNGDDAEAVWYACGLAIEYRQKFKKDFFIDLICYRKYGHNEGDEPAFTQPLMYKKIKTHPSTREIYAQKLSDLGVVNTEGAQTIVDQLNEMYTAAQEKARATPNKPPVSAYEGRWSSVRRATSEELFTGVDTRVSAETLRGLAEKINHFPAGFTLHSKLGRFFEARLKAVQEGKGIDWGNGETLAYASLLTEKRTVRISGQDVERGTFTHRHAVLHDSETGQVYSPLRELAKQHDSSFLIFNSHLSETGVMGFDYGWSLADPDALVIWEAQFGDFANGAQIIIDQFLSAAESKWQRASGLVLLLPHGYEGQGPEHSSARLERFLQLCGKGNFTVCNLTTPAQIFHALRRQVKRSFRKPLIIMSPKSLLRHPQAISKLEDFTERGFQEILDDPSVDPAKVTRVLMCTGKIYYELLAEKAARKRDDVAIIRLEQMYPWPEGALSMALNRYPQAEITWVQEEPRNMGAWSFVFGQWLGGLGLFSTQVGGRSIKYIGRDIGAAPAVGSSKVHAKEQKAILEQAFS